MLGLSRLRIVTKLMLLVALFVAGLGAFGAVAYSTLDKVKVGGPVYAEISTNKDLLADILPPPQFIIEAHLVAHLLGDCDNPTRQSELIARAESLEKEFNDRHTFWNNALPTGELKTALTRDAYEPAVAFFKAMDEQFLPSVKKNDLETARAVLGGPMLEAYTRHRTAIDRSVELATRDSKALETTAAETLSTRTTSMYALGGGIGLFVGVLGWLIATSIINPIRRMEQGVASIGEGGKMDMTRRLNTETNDELAALCAKFNAIIATLDAIIAKVSHSSHSVVEGCREILESSETVARAIDTQSRQTEGVGSAVLESNQSIGEVASKAVEASKMSGNAGKDAQTGGEVVAKTLDHMRSISEMVAASSTRIAELGTQSDEIGRIIEVINDIADQTNLLALNAAIEAARAGEHGRGFAVVADEVRKLADRTTKATGEVATSIKAIQEGTGSAVNSMKGVTERVAVGVKLAEQAGTSLGTICDGTGSVAMIIESIASATQEQTSACEEIGRNVTLISQAGQECSDGAKRAATVAANLSGRAQELEQLVSGFTVSKSR